MKGWQKAMSLVVLSFVTLFLTGCGAGAEPEHGSMAITAESYEFPPAEFKQETLKPLSREVDSTELTEHLFVNEESEANGPMGRRVLSALRGPDGDMWFGTDSGVSRFDGDSWYNYRLVEGERLDFWEDTGFPLVVLSLTLSPDGHVVAGGCGGIYRYAGGEWNDYWPADSDFVWMDCTWPLAVGPEEELWFGIFDGQTNGFGVFHFDGDVWTRYQDDTMTEFDIVEGFPEVTTATEGKFLADNFVTSIATDPDGAMWFVTSNMISRFDGQEWMNISGIEYLLGEILSVTGGLDRPLWFHTDQAFSHFDGEIWTAYSITDVPMEHFPSSYSTTDIYGDLWFGVPNGLFHFDGENLTNFNLPEELSLGWTTEQLKLMMMGPCGYLVVMALSVSHAPITDVTIILPFCK